MKGIFIILLFITCAVIAQDKNELIKGKDYYIKVIDTTQNKDFKLTSLDSLVSILIKQDIKGAAFYAEQYVDLALELEKYNEALKKANRASIKIYNTIRDYNQGIAILDKLKPFLSKIKDPTLIGDFYRSKGINNAYLGNFNESLNCYDKAFSAYSYNDSIKVAKLFYNRAAINAMTGNLLVASADYKSAMTLHERSGDIENYIHASTGLVTIYGVLGFYEKQIKEYLNILKQREQNNFKANIFLDYLNISTAYAHLKDKKNEEKYLLKSLEACLIEDIFYQDLILVYSTLTNFYLHADDLKKAKKYFALVEKEYKEKKLPRIAGQYSTVKLFYLYKTKKYNEAVKYGEKTLKEYRQNGYVYGEKDINNILYEVYRDMGNAKRALISYTNFSVVNDSLNNITKTNAFNYYQALYETEKKEKEIMSQSNKILVLNQKNKAQNILILFIILGSGLILISAIILIKRRQLLKEKKLQQEFSRDLLVTQEQERKRISEDLHDGLGQSLLVVKNEITLQNYEKSKSLLNSSIEEMRTIARSLYPFQLNNIGVARAIDNLVVQLNDSSNQIRFFTEMELVEEKLSDLQRVNVFRIVQECLSNIIKHSQANSAKVTLRIQDKKAKILIQDNGVGFDFSKKYNTINTLGLKTIQERASFLKGTLEIDSKKDQGTTFSITFPIAV